MTKKIVFLLSSLLLLFTACQNRPNPEAPMPANPASTKIVNHQAWEALLQKHVDESGYLDYAGLSLARESLQTYLHSLASVVPAEYSKDEQLAFWINAYNAFVVADVLDDVRGKVKSVKEVEEKFFRTKKHSVAGTELTLDEIEKRGRDLNDPRLHFALVCASASCPKLQPFAYQGAKLDYQLTTAAQQFLGDVRRGSRYESTQNALYISPIFKWYAADFTNDNAVVARAKAELSGAEMLEVILRYVPNDVKNFLQSRNPRIDYFEYDWSLNEQFQSQAEKAVTPSPFPSTK